MIFRRSAVNVATVVSAAVGQDNPTLSIAVNGTEIGDTYRFVLSIACIFSVVCSHSIQPYGKQFGGEKVGSLGSSCGYPSDTCWL